MTLSEIELESAVDKVLHVLKDFSKQESEAVLARSIIRLEGLE